MNLKQLFLTNNNCYKSGKRQVIKGIMVHSTGANNPYLKRYIGPDDGILGINEYNNHWNTATPDGQSVCVHAFIGKDKNNYIRTYQTLPWDMVGWHSGNGRLGSKNNANNNGYIGFEICEDDLKDQEYFKAVYKEAVELCVFLCYKYSLNPDNDIICHSEGNALGIASNHADVMHWFPKHGKNMDMFRADVKAIISATQTSGSFSNLENYKKIIQQYCRFSAPDKVFSHIDKFKYAAELYKKWADSYSNLKDHKKIIQQNCNFSVPDNVFSHIDNFAYSEELYKKWADSYGNNSKGMIV